MHEVPMLKPEDYERLGKARLERGAVADVGGTVVSIRTGGRALDQVSRRLVERGVALPVLTVPESEHGVVDGRAYVFIAVSVEDVPSWSEEHAGECACSALLAAAHAHMRTLAVPLFGGEAFIATMEWAVHYIEDALEPTGISMPEVFFVATDGDQG